MKSVSAAILSTGNTFQRIKELMDVINVSFIISHTTFNAIQKKYLFPAIHRVCTTKKHLIVDNPAEKGDIDLLGLLGYVILLVITPNMVRTHF